jgi:hypothetical protein
LGKSIVPLVVGLIVIAAAIAATFWNERRAGASSELRDLVRASVVDAAVQEVREELEGRILRVVGRVEAAGEVLEPTLGRSFPFLRLERVAETAQWQEHRQNTQGGRDLSYTLVWSAARIDSTRFQDGGGAHPNPPLRLESDRFLAPSPRIGAWSADAEIWHAIPATDEIGLPDRFQLDPIGRMERFQDWWWSGDPARPAPGDVRLRYRAAQLGIVSLIGRAVSGRITTLTSKRGERLPLAAKGDVPAERLVGESAALSAAETWKVRVLTLAMFLLGSFILAFALKRLTPELVGRLGGSIPSAGSLTGLLLWLLFSVTIWLLVRFR